MSNINPRTWKSLDIEKPAQWQVFINQLVQYLIDQFTASVIGPLAGASQSAINGGALVLVNPALGSVATAQTVNCANATAVTVSLTITASITLTLSNLQVGIPVVIKASSSGTFTLKLAATNVSGTAYAITGITTAGATANLVTTGLGLSSAVSVVLPGNSVTEIAGPTLYLGVIG